MFTALNFPYSKDTHCSAQCCIRHSDPYIAHDMLLAKYWQLLEQCNTIHQTLAAGRRPDGYCTGSGSENFMSLSRLTVNAADHHIDAVILQKLPLHRLLATDPDPANFAGDPVGLLHDFGGDAIPVVVVILLWRMQCKLQYSTVQAAHVECRMCSACNAMCSRCRMQYNDWKMKGALATDAV